MVRVPDVDQRRPGEAFMAKHPDWPHECCFRGPCPHRTSSAGAMRCEAPSDCEFYCEQPPQEEEDHTI